MLAAVHSELDLRRLAELPEVLGAELPAIVATLVTELAGAVDAIEAGLSAGDADAVARAAHAGRNSALIIDSQPLLAPLDEIESSARHSDLATAAAANARLVEVWPPLRQKLERVAAGKN
jgi:hypothetical protein